jgi:uncharacterized cupredoxin-like copper-binding protein
VILALRLRSVGVLASLVMAVAVGIVACGGGGPSNKSNAPVTSTVTVSLKEWSVEASAQQVKPGTVTFVVSNAGTMPHDFVVIKSDLPPEQLPVDADGRVIESKVNTLGRIDAFAAGSTQSLSLDLTPGKYLLICNVVDASGSKPVSHYRNGMVASLLVSF